MTTQLSWFTSSYSGSEGGQCVEVALEWRKSTYSGSEGGECVEVATAWRTSSHSGSAGGDCVEVGRCPALVHVRDSKDRGGPELTFTPEAWEAFVAYAAAARV
jgi:hypothetical protein